MSASQITVDSRRLLAMAQAGHSQRGIARRLGLKPTFVRQRLNQLLRESTTDFSAKCAKTEPEGPDRPQHLLPEGDTPPGYDPANIRRCQGCGSLVYLWPCLACQMAADVASISIRK
jgi:hypothetical protein